MKAVFGEQKAQLFTLGLTSVGRLWAALERLFFFFIALSIGGAVFYLPDYLGYYRDREPVPGMLLGILLAGALLLSLLAALLRFFRREIWVVDLDEKALIYQSGKLFRKGVQQMAIDFEYIERFWVEVHPGLRDSHLLVQLSDGGGQRMLVTRFGADSLGEAAGQLAEFLRRKKIAIPVERADSDAGAG